MDHILVIEDERNIRETLKDALEIAGYKVSLAEDGIEGCKAIIELAPDLVLCDVGMPGMNGFEVLATIKERFREEIIPPFLFLSAKVQLEDIRSGMNLGADDYVTKPFKITDLLESIRMRLRNRRMLLEQQKSSSQGSGGKMSVPTSEGLVIISVSDLMKVEADRAYCKFHLKDRKLLHIAKPMKEFEQVLEQKGFIRVHKSYMVNLDHIVKYVRGSGGYLVLSDGSNVDVSVRRKEELLQRLRNLPG